MALAIYIPKWNNENMKIFGERLKAARKAKGYANSTELGEVLSVGNSTVSRWEAGEREPSLETVIKLAGILSVSAAYLMGETDDPEPKSGLFQNVSNFVYIPDENDLMEISLFDIVSVASYWADCMYSAIPGEVKKIYIEKSAFEKLDDERMPFAIYAEGDAMTGADIDTGDILIISPADAARSGDVVFVRHGDMWMVRWIYHRPDGSIELRAASPNYAPVVIAKENAENTLWYHLVGKVIEVRHKPKTGI